MLGEKNKMGVNDWLRKRRTLKIAKQSSKEEPEETEKKKITKDLSEEQKKKINSISAKELLKLNEEDLKIKAGLKKKYHKYICSLRKCKTKLKLVNRFKCNYCKREFCQKHRLPEEHNCKDPKLPFQMKKGFGNKGSHIIK
jgi:hypothetical protein